MRTILTTLLLISFLSLEAQIKNDYMSHEIDLRLDLAGQKFNNGGNLLVGASVVGVLGAAISTLGILTQEQEVAYLGAGLTIVSVPLGIAGFASIAKGGKLLRKPTGVPEDHEMSEQELRELRERNKEYQKRQ